MFKKIALLLFTAAILFSITGCKKTEYSYPEYNGKGSDTVIIKVKGYETPIVVKLCPEYAPYTVANFKNNVEKGLYNGTTFHRIIKNFMIQGGDPQSAGKEDTGPIVGEFKDNGIKNDLKHERGVLSMARTSSNPNSATSQFFICHTTEGCQHLDGGYAAFGYVVSGMETVDLIASVTTNYNGKPMINVVIDSITFAD